MIRVDGIRKSYGSGPGAVRAVRDVTFSAEPGEVVALLGRNGAGKSTTVRILATLLRPDGGRAAVAGRDVVEEPASVRALLGVALQQTGVPRRHTGRRLLRLHALLAGVPRAGAERRVDELLQTFGLERTADRFVSTYSGGERRLLDVALAIVHEPPVVLLDEPTAGLDVPTRAAIWRELAAHVQAGATVLFTTHDLREADENAHRIVIVDRGTVVAQGTPDELKRRLRSRALRLSFGTARDALRAAEILEGRLIAGDTVVVPLLDTRETFDVLHRLTAYDVEVESIAIDEPTLDAIFEQTTDASRGDGLDAVARELA